MPDIQNGVKRIREQLGRTKIILSVDRLDYAKAILNRLESFELFLDQNPEYRQKVSYVLLTVPTREAILKYKENKSNIEGLVSRINGRYGAIGWTPVVYQYRSVDLRKLVTLYAASDIALIVPLRDGMNLVAKEFIASRPNSDGVLILSETAGAARELSEAILVNANDRQEISDAILKALQMPVVEQRLRIKKMQEHIRNNDVVTWASDFLNSINQIHSKVESEA